MNGVALGSRRRARSIRRGVRCALLLSALTGAAFAAATEGVPVYRRVFVTSTSGTGDLRSWVEVTQKGISGTEAADVICQARAEAASLATGGDPLFVAWLSDSTSDAYCRVQGFAGTKAGGCGGADLQGAGPWVRTDGLLWGSEIDTLTSAEPAGGPFVQINLDENGDPALDKSFVSGTNEAGVLTSADGDCLEWENGTIDESWDGSLTNAVDGWSGGARTNCAGTGLRLLCVETGVGDTPPPLVDPGALAFVTSTACSGAIGDCTSQVGDSGVAAADNVCVARAIAGRLPSPQTFFAWISVTGSPAGARVTGPGPWKRVDGYPVAANAAGWKDGHLDAPIFETELGTEIASPTVWTGTTTAGNASNSDCGGWTSNSAGVDGTEGWPVRTHSYWTAQNNFANCNEPRSLYCLSNQVVIFWHDFEPGGVDPEWSDSEGLP